MTTPYSRYTLTDAQSALPDTPAWLIANAAYYAGDHWQQGKAWTGPVPPEGHALYGKTLLEIKRAFTSKNAVAETTDRHRDAVIGVEPAWSLTPRRPLTEGEEPTPDEQTLIDEAEAALTTWWDERGALDTLQEAVAVLLYAARSPLRLYVPSGLLEELPDGAVAVPSGSLEESLGRIWFEAPDVKSCAVHTDDDTKADIGVFLFEQENVRKAELCYLDGNATVIRIVGGETEQESRLDLGGRLTIYEMERRVLITEQVRQSQNLLNLALTMLQRNVVQGGFLERTIFNAQMPGEYQDDPETGERKLVPAPLHMGPGVTTFLAAMPYEGEDGKTYYLNPDVVYRDPVKIDTFTGTDEKAYRNILEETFQLHRILDDASDPSGESRKEARVDFVSSLRKTRTQAEKALRWLLETALAMAAQFSGQPGRFAGLRVDAECRLDLGPVSAYDQEGAIKLRDAGFISLETGMGRVGVDDVDAEKTRIAAEKAEQPTQSQPVTDPTTEPTNTDEGEQ